MFQSVYIYIYIYILKCNKGVYADDTFCSCTTGAL